MTDGAAMSGAGWLCWRCGAPLAAEAPLGRAAECKACRADLHVCRMCEFYDPGVAKSCREPIAEEVPEKERANFCEYFRPRRGVCAAPDGAAEAARARLASLFGLEPAAPAKPKPEDLFGPPAEHK